MHWSAQLNTLKKLTSVGTDKQNLNFTIRILTKSFKLKYNMNNGY